MLYGLANFGGPTSDVCIMVGQRPMIVLGNRAFRMERNRTMLHLHQEERVCNPTEILKCVPPFIYRWTF